MIFSACIMFKFSVIHSGVEDKTWKQSGNIPIAKRTNKTFLVNFDGENYMKCSCFAVVLLKISTQDKNYLNKKTKKKVRPWQASIQYKLVLEIKSERKKDTLDKEESYS